MAHPEYNVPTTEISFSETPLGPHRSWQKNKKRVREVITLTVSKNRTGPKNYLIKDKEE